jgi:hypothetical protein
MEQGTGKSKIVIDEATNLSAMKSIVIILAPNGGMKIGDQFEHIQKIIIMVFTYRSKNNERHRTTDTDIINLVGCS